MSDDYEEGFLMGLVWWAPLPVVLIALVVYALAN